MCTWCLNLWTCLCWMAEKKEKINIPQFQMDLNDLVMCGGGTAAHKTNVWDQEINWFLYAILRFNIICVICVICLIYILVLKVRKRIVFCCSIFFLSVCLCVLCSIFSVPSICLPHIYILYDTPSIQRYDWVLSRLMWWIHCMFLLKA